jgi:hypothetical protein
MNELLDQENGDAGISHLLQALENRLDDDRCKAKRHLVRDEQLWFHCERPAQGKHLLFPSGQASRSLASSRPEDWKKSDGPFNGGIPFGTPSGSAGGHLQVVEH